MNSRNKSNRKGMSISEMCVVLAVVAIAALAVVSFTTMVSARSMASAIKLQALDSVTRTRIVVEQWANAMERNNAEEFTVAPDGTALTAKIGGQEYTVTMSREHIAAQMPDGNELSLSVEQIEALEFDVMARAEDTLVFCTVTYRASKSAADNRSITFCINPHAGEILATPNGG